MRIDEIMKYYSVKRGDIKMKNLKSILILRRDPRDDPANDPKGADSRRVFDPVHIIRILLEDSDPGVT